MRLPALPLSPPRPWGPFHRRWSVSCAVGAQGWGLFLFFELSPCSMWPLAGAVRFSAEGGTQAEAGRADAGAGAGGRVLGTAGVVSLRLRGRRHVCGQCGGAWFSGDGRVERRAAGRQAGLKAQGCCWGALLLAASVCWRRAGQEGALGRGDLATARAGALARTHKHQYTLVSMPSVISSWL